MNYCEEVSLAGVVPVAYLATVAERAKLPFYVRASKRDIAERLDLIDGKGGDDLLQTTGAG